MTKTMAKMAEKLNKLVVWDRHPYYDATLLDVLTTPAGNEITLSPLGVPSNGAVLDCIKVVEKKADLIKLKVEESWFDEEDGWVLCGKWEFEIVPSEFGLEEFPMGLEENFW